jgi:peptidoglycan/LPS O-acetylase OafA/YrhL
VRAPPIPAASNARAHALDTVKGVLVLVMVGYHALSITTTADAEVFRFIRFISGSFIFISGFVIARFMAERYAQEPAAMSRRLVWRGLKIVALFTALNLAIALSGIGNVAKQQLGFSGFIANALTIYLWGDGRMASFTILLPIGYLMIATPVVLTLFARATAVAPPALLVLVLALIAHPAVGDRSLNVDFMLIGLAGMAVGAPPWAQRLFEAVAPSMFVLTPMLAVTLWFTGRWGGQGPLYVVGVALIFKLLHDGARQLPESGAVMRLATLLGRYSLFAYIAQIALIQFLFRASSTQRWGVGAEVALLCLVTAALMIASCMALDRARLSSPLVDKSYRLVFS